jgi:hypothetical protein
MSSYDRNEADLIDELKAQFHKQVFYQGLGGNETDIEDSYRKDARKQLGSFMDEPTTVCG